MSDNKRTPSHTVYFIKTSNSIDEKTKKNKTFWTPIGAGWATKTGRINVVFEFIPIGKGTIQVVPADQVKNN